jgi:hypothetical protein
VKKSPDGKLVLSLVLLTNELSQIVDQGAVVGCTGGEEGASVILLLGGNSN